MGKVQKDYYSSKTVSRFGIRILITCLLVLLAFSLLGCEQMEQYFPLLEQIIERFGSNNGESGESIETPGETGDPSEPAEDAGNDLNDNENGVPHQGPLVVPDNYSTIQAAINASWHGDVIIVRPGTYEENIDFKGRNITLQSTDPENPAIAAQTIIDGQGIGPVVSFAGGQSRETRLLGFTITGGDAGTSSGGGIRITGNAAPQIKFNIITDNNACYGAGAFVANKSQPTFENNIFYANTANRRRGAGIYVVGQSRVIIRNSTFRDHEGADGVIHIYDNAYAEITGNTIINNSTDFGVGGIKVVLESTALITGNTITGNTGAGDHYAGAISIHRNSQADITNNTISDNKGKNVGAVCIYRYSEATIEGNTITGNEAGSEGVSSGAGGGIMITYYTNVDITGNTITNNKAWHHVHSGGGIAIYGWGQENNVTISDNVLNNNRGYRWGGGIFASGTETTVLIKDNSIENNRVGDHWLADGGGIYLRSGVKATIYDNKIFNNWAEHKAGGIYVARDPLVFGRDGIPWNRACCPPGSETNNIYEGNAHGHDRCTSIDVYFHENYPCY